jgi:S1-C subfamily serine protease
MILEVTPNSSAAKAGLVGVRRGEDFYPDVIVAFNGKPVNNYTSLQKFIRDCKVGDLVKLKILRDGTKEMTLEVELEGD